MESLSLHCGCCGYNLTGLTTDRCPECGRRPVFSTATGSDWPIWFRRPAAGVLSRYLRSLKACLVVRKSLRFNDRLKDVPMRALLFWAWLNSLVWLVLHFGIGAVSFGLRFRHHSVVVITFGACVNVVVMLFGACVKLFVADMACLLAVLGLAQGVFRSKSDRVQRLGYKPLKVLLYLSYLPLLNVVALGVCATAAQLGYRGAMHHGIELAGACKAFYLWMWIKGRATDERRAVVVATAYFALWVFMVRNVARPYSFGGFPWLM